MKETIRTKIKKERKERGLENSGKKEQRNEGTRKVKGRETQAAREMKEKEKVKK